MRHLVLRDQDLAALRGTFRRFAAVREVRVFGSRATGRARRASDLDLAIFAPEASPAEWADLCDSLESAPLIYELDLVRTEQTANARLLEKITREGVPIYPDEPAR